MNHTIDSQTWHQHAWNNRLQSLLLLLFMAGFLAFLGHLLWGSAGLVMLVVVGLLMLALTPSLSPGFLLRMYGARPITPSAIPGLWQAHVQLSARAGLPNIPPLYYIPSRALIAFAVGRRGQAAIALSDGLLRSLNGRELAGVLGHELSHIRSNDVWVMSVADLFSRMTSLFSLMGQLLLLFSLPLWLFGSMEINWLALLMLILAPGLALLTQMALSRTREFDADLNSAALTGDPEGLASALRRIEQVQGQWLEGYRVLRPRQMQPSLLRSHPVTAERISRLLALKPQMQPRPWNLTLDDLQTLLSPHDLRRPRRHYHGLWY